MKNGTIIEDVVGCLDGKGDVGDVSFGMTGYEAVGERRAELSFWLWVYRVGYVDSLLLFCLAVKLLYGVIALTLSFLRAEKVAMVAPLYSTAQQQSPRTTRRNRLATSRAFLADLSMG